MVLEIDEELRRISLSIRHCHPNPWEEFAATHNKNDKVIGRIKSITDFGIFIGLDGGIDGLVHMSDISWNIPGDEAVRQFKKGDEVEAVVLAVDAERERISLGIKQLEKESFSHYISQYPKGSVVKGIVTEIANNKAIVQLDTEVDGVLRIQELARERVEDINHVLKENQEIEAKIINVDRKKRSINLSIKALVSDEESAVLENYSNSQQENNTSATLGDLIKEQVDKQ
jgi:small subunit ribosomal protein S1